MTRLTPVAGGAVRPADAYPRDSVRAAKGDQSVTVCLPARNEAGTVGAIVGAVCRDLVPEGLVDDVVVMDHGSTDGTAAVAAEAGARVVDADTVMAHHGPAVGKGDVLWRSLAVCRTDVVVWCDADLASFDPAYVVGLLGPMLCEPGTAMVRGVYDRTHDGVVGEGGRVTELMARPALALLFPHLSHVRQPLGGEYAVRRDVVTRLPFEPDYGVEMGLLLDVAAATGVGSIAQVDLGRRDHRNRPLAELAPQAEQVLRAALRRALPESERAGYPRLRPPLSGPGAGVLAG